MFFCLLVLFFGKTAMAQMGYEYFLVATYEIPEFGKVECAGTVH
jgi:hypothetical protein